MGGRVLDPQGAVVPDAVVVVRSDDTGVEQTTQTNAQGNWIAGFLIPGNYSISVSAAGFKQADRHGIALQTADQKHSTLSSSWAPATLKSRPEAMRS